MQVHAISAHPFATFFGDIVHSALNNEICKSFILHSHGFHDLPKPILLT